MLAVTGGSHLLAGGSGDSTSRRTSTDDDDADDPGSTNPDAGEQQVSMPPLLLIAAYRYMEIEKHRMVFVPLLQHLADNWQDRELTDVSVLVAKLFLWRHVMKQATVQLSELLGSCE